jgi:hypothetical protein
MSLPTADTSATVQKQAVSAAVTGKLKINYGDEAKVNRLSKAISNVKILQGRAQEHVQDIKSKIIM